MTAPRIATLRAALGFLQLTPHEPEPQLLHGWLDSCREPLHSPPGCARRRARPGRSAGAGLVHRWLDNWHGVGLLAVGLHRIGYDLDLRQYGDGHWRASFYVTGPPIRSWADRLGNLYVGERGCGRWSVSCQWWGEDKHSQAAQHQPDRRLRCGWRGPAATRRARS